MEAAIQAFAGAYDLDRAHSTIQFAIRHQQIAMFRGSFDAVDVRLTADNDMLDLEGRAQVETISIGEPREFRDHVVHGADFFDAGSHPLVTFRSTSIDLGDDGRATVRGELTIRGATRTVTAHGTYEPTREDPFGNHRAGLALQATIDRRNWDMNWQMPLPDGTDALGWDVEISAELELVRAA
jgi:polyisoprenoid-binding protein YceI